MDKLCAPLNCREQTPITPIFVFVFVFGCVLVYVPRVAPWGRSVGGVLFSSLI